MPADQPGRGTGLGFLHGLAGPETPSPSCPCAGLSFGEVESSMRVSRLLNKEVLSHVFGK